MILDPCQILVVRPHFRYESSTRADTNWLLRLSIYLHSIFLVPFWFTLVTCGDAHKMCRWESVCTIGFIKLSNDKCPPPHTNWLTLKSNFSVRFCWNHPYFYTQGDSECWNDVAYFWKCTQCMRFEIVANGLWFNIMKLFGIW